MALRMAELGEDFSLLFTPTGNELPDLAPHIAAVVAKIDRPLIMPPGPSLDGLITLQAAIPNFRQRWCTRMIKIVPCIAWLKAHPGTALCVGLRADEENREGLYGDFATYRYPLREWGWKISDVFAYLNRAGWKVPKRTDCALCYGQRLGEWYALWRDYPAEYAKGEVYEATYGHTFRSAQRDTWPAALKDLRAEFERGRRPKGVDEPSDAEKACRVCAA